MKKTPKGQANNFDLLPNSLNVFNMKMYRDQSGEFVCRNWGVKG